MNEEWKAREFERSLALDRARLQAEHERRVKKCLCWWKKTIDRSEIQDRAFAEIAAEIAGRVAA